MLSARNFSLRGLSAGWLLVLALILPAVAVAAGTSGTSGTGRMNGTPSPSRAAAHEPDLKQPHRAGVLLVGYEDGTTATERSAARRRVGAISSGTLSHRATNAERVQLDATASLKDAIAVLKEDPNVRYAEPDYIVHRTATSNDPLYVTGSLWGMYGDTSPLQTNQFGSGAAEAWAQGYTGSRNVFVGIIDEGIQDSHPDLTANIWTNPGEIAANGIDDDRNGFIDDIHGWDFANSDSSTFDGTGADNVDSHGTHVAGTIGGSGGNSMGVAGVNWKSSMISAKFLGAGGTGAISNAVKALDYLVDMKVNHGVNIVATNNSWGGGGFSQAMLDAINRGGDAGILFIASAGNNTTNNDASATYPSSYECTNGGTRGWDCLVSVAAIDSTGALASFSNYGATTVDLGAPGVAVVSTFPLDSYVSLSGTSMAAPHVTGAVALCASINPSLTAMQLRTAVISSAQATSSLTGKTTTGGRLDVGAMTAGCQPATAPVTGGATAFTTSAAPSSSISLSWTDEAQNEQLWEIQQSPAGCGSFTTITSVPVGTTTALATGLRPSTSYCFRVRATNGYSGGTESTWSSVSSATTLPPYTCVASPYKWLDATTDGKSLTLSDDASASVALPFPFSYDGASVSEVQVSSNGFLRLGKGLATEFVNVGIPAATQPNGFVAAFWDDLSPQLGGSIYYTTVGTAPNRQFVVAWVGVPRYSVSGSAVTFEIVLDEASGAITIQYLDTLVGSATYDNGASATAGVENTNGSEGTQISYNTAKLQSLTAYSCTASMTTAPLISTISLPDGTVTSAYASTLAATGGQTPYAWTIVAGALPAGLTLNPSSGIVGGTPTAAATSTFTAQVAGADGAISTRSMTIRVALPLTVSTTSLASGSVATAYSATLAATGGQTPYAWSISTGSLPPGLALAASTGTITGTPSTAGSWTFTVLATDGGSPVRTATGSLTITVNGAKAAVTVTASTPASIVAGATYPAVTFTTNPTPVTWTTAPTCAVYATAVSTVKLTGVSTAGSYVTRCEGGVSATYTPTYVNGTLTVNAPTVPVVVYTGSFLIAPGGAITSSATSTPTTCTGALTYTIDRNPLTGVVGAYALPTTSTTSWLRGVYTVTVTKAASATCAAVSVSTSTLTVQPTATTPTATGARAYGGGQYTVVGARRVSAGFQISGSTPTGQFRFIQTDTWQFVGALTTYSRTGTTGTATGTGTLSYWNTTTKAWVSVGTTIPVSIVFTSGTSGTLATTFTYTPTVGQPALPTTTAQGLGTQITANA